MKILKNILSVLLVSAVLNTVVVKGLHEFFEHHHEVHTCLNKDQTHFHEVELAHFDLICNFNFTTYFFNDFSNVIDCFLTCYNQFVSIEFNRLADDLLHFNFLLRGPPNN